MASTVLIPWTVDKSLIKSGLSVPDHLYELYTTVLDRVESQHILRELKRTKANTKKIIFAVEYGDIDEYITKKEMEMFHDFIVKLDANDLTNDQYVSNKYKAEYLDMMGIINDEY